jgi:hypothetical protein
VTRSIEVCFSPLSYPLFKNDEAIVVIIDIFRATSAICTAFHHGVNSVIPVATVDEAWDYKRKGYIAAAERQGEVVPGFEFGNSPFSYMGEGVKGKTIVLTTTNGTQVQVWDCWNGANQRWTHNANGELSVYSGSSRRCLDARDWGTGNGTVVQIYQCHGGNNQRWNRNSNGSISNVHNGLCLDVANFGTGNGSQVQLWSCSGGNNQQWTF